jgi:hypothetical protein
VAGIPVAVAAGLCPQATLEVELEQVLGVEVLRSGRELAFGQELGGRQLAALGSWTSTARPLRQKASSLASAGNECRA